MKLTEPTVCRTGLVVVALVLAGCGGMPDGNGAARTDTPSRARSWMQPAGLNADLLYISDANGEVTVYRYWHRTLLGILTGFTQPMGLCVDNRGDVYVADYGAQQIVEYSHGGTKPIGTLSSTPYNPYDCSVNPANGDLAVANTQSGSYGGGNIAIYAHASGRPAYYTDVNVPTYQSCVYDSDGNLLVTNGDLRRSGSATFAWLPSGGKRLLDINVPGPNPSWSWYYLEGLQWDGKFFVLDDQSGLYRVALLKGQLFYVGYTYLNIESPSAYWVYNNNPKQQGTQIVGAYDSGASYYKYPDGGNALYYISHGIDNPAGVTVSLKKR